MPADLPLHIACSPDADDRFMMWALTHARLDTGPFDVHVDFHPTHELNALAGPDGPDVLALDRKSVV